MVYSNRRKSSLLATFASICRAIKFISIAALAPPGPKGVWARKIAFKSVSLKFTTNCTIMQ